MCGCGRCRCPLPLLTPRASSNLQPLGRDILSWCADDQLFTASGAVAPGKSLPTQVHASHVLADARILAPARAARLLSSPGQEACGCEHRQQHSAQEAPCATRDPAVSPQGWPLADFPTALAIAIAYLLFVVIGSLAMQVRDRESRRRKLAARCAVPLEVSRFCRV